MLYKNAFFVHTSSNFVSQDHCINNENENLIFYFFFYLDHISSLQDNAPTHRLTACSEILEYSGVRWV